MIILAHEADITLIDNKLPFSIAKIINNSISILDNEYGDSRDIYKDLGGFVAIIEQDEDLTEISKRFHFDFDTVIAEIVDIIDNFISALIIISNDYVIHLMMPMELASPNLIRQGGN